MEEVVGIMTPEQFWEWRYKIAELQIAEKDLKIVKGQQALLHKDYEILRLNIGLFKNHVDSAEATQKLASDQYQEYRKGLEERLGFSLSECMIDEVTLEVKRVPVTKEK